MRQIRWRSFTTAMRFAPDGEWEEVIIGVDEDGAAFDVERTDAGGFRYTAIPHPSAREPRAAKPTAAERQLAHMHAKTAKLQEEVAQFAAALTEEQRQRRVDRAAADVALWNARHVVGIEVSLEEPPPLQEGDAVRTCSPAYVHSLNGEAAYIDCEGGRSFSRMAVPLARVVRERGRNGDAP